MDRGLSDMASVLLCCHTLMVLLDEHEKSRLLASPPTGGGTAEAAGSLGVSSRLVFRLLTSSSRSLLAPLSNKNQMTNTCNQ